MATLHKVTEAGELSEDGDRSFVEIEGVEIAVFNIDGEYYAMANYCVHQGGPLCEGDLRGSYGIGDESWEWTYDNTERNVVCPWHGWKFDIETGQNVEDSKFVTPTYAVEIIDDEIFVRR